MDLLHGAFKLLDSNEYSFSMYRRVDQWRSNTYLCAKLHFFVVVVSWGMASQQVNSCEFATPKFYALCGLGGVISCGTTHTAIVPLDLVKCRLQVDKAKYGNLTQGFRVTIKEEGIRGLARGWAPTFFGYSMQGLGKFGFYEMFKHTYSNMLSEVSNLLWNMTLIGTRLCLAYLCLLGC